MEIICLTVGGMSTNCYLVTDEKTRETIIIDPGDEGDFISTTILENKLLPKAVILTHGHYDHCLAVLELKLNFNLPIYLHQQDLFLYQKAHSSASYWSHFSLVKGRSPATGGERDLKPSPIDHFLTDNEIIAFGNSSLKVIHTPGHTPGSVCLISCLPCQGKVSEGRKGLKQKGSLFTGDTLFASGVGSTDHSYSSKSDLQKSLTNLNSLFKLHNSNLLIYPGHEDFGVLQAINTL